MFSLLISKKKSEEFIVSDVCLHIPASTYSDKQGQCKFKIFMNKKYTMYISFLTPILILVQEVLVKLITPIKMLPVF